MASLRDRLTSLKRPPAAFRQQTRSRVLEEILGSLEGRGSTYKVLVMDSFAVKFLNAVCSTTEVVGKNVAQLLALEKRRETQPTFDAIYFIRPSQESVRQLIDDMVDKPPRYRMAHVLFTSTPSPDLLKGIKNSQILKPRLATLQEVNLEYLVVDGQAFTTDQESALGDLFSPSCPEFGAASQNCIELAASRLATVFASLNEHPRVRYRSAVRPPDSPSLPHRGSAPQRLSSSLLERLSQLQTSLSHFPPSHTCDLLLVDRSVDLIAPFIHDWSYGGMAYDLLPMEGNKYTWEIPEGAKYKAQTAVLDDTDPLWVDLRDRFLPEATLKICDLVDQLKAVRDTRAETLKEMGELVQTLPKFMELKARVDIHFMITKFLSDRVNLEELKEIGQSEQGFVFGDKHSLDLEQLLIKQKGMSSERKKRLLCVYGATHPDKFDLERWRTVSGLSDSDMENILQLQFLGVDFTKKMWHERKFQHKFHLRSKEQATKVERLGLRTFYRKPTEGTHALFRFYPYIRDLTEDLAAGSLPEDFYPTAKNLEGEFSGQNMSESTSSGSRERSGSVRTHNWAAPKKEKIEEISTNEGPASRKRSPELGLGGKSKGRIFIFIIGGMTRAEVRAAHWLSEQLGREVVVGSTSIDTASQFLEKLQDLSS